MANPPATIGPFTNVPAPGSPIRSDWPSQAAQLIYESADTKQGTTAPYVGASGTSQRIKVRAGHLFVTTGAGGDAAVTFQTPFPNGLISLQITPVQTAMNVFWWPVVTGTFLNYFQFIACAPSGYPFASGHPPSYPNVYTIASAGIYLDYLAIGV